MLPQIPFYHITFFIHENRQNSKKIDKIDFEVKYDAPADIASLGLNSAPVTKQVAIPI